MKKMYKFWFIWPLIDALLANQHAESVFSVTVLLAGFRFYETVIKSNGRESYQCLIRSQFSQNGQTLKYDKQLNIPSSESFPLTRYVVKCIFLGVDSAQFHARLL